MIWIIHLPIDHMLLCDHFSVPWILHHHDLLLPYMPSLPIETITSLIVTSMTCLFISHSALFPGCQRPQLANLRVSLDWLLVTESGLCIKRQRRDQDSFLLICPAATGVGNWAARGHSRLKTPHNQECPPCLETWLVKPFDSSPGILERNHLSSFSLYPTKG